jgi:hypothetical protein
MQAEKAELERQFNDSISFALRSQDQEELSVARRLDWIRAAFM